MNQEIIARYLGEDICLLLRENKIYCGILQDVTDTTTILLSKRYGKTCVMNESIVSISENAREAM